MTRLGPFLMYWDFYDIHLFRARVSFQINFVECLPPYFYIVADIAFWGIIHTMQAHFFVFFYANLSMLFVEVVFTYSYLIENFIKKIHSEVVNSVHEESPGGKQLDKLLEDVQQQIHQIDLESPKSKASIAPAAPPPQ